MCHVKHTYGLWYYIITMQACKILSEFEISEFLLENQDWKYENSQFVASYTFPSFKAAMSVVNSVAIQAEKLNHHPNWSNEYNKLSFSLCTHEAGNNVTILDIQLAQSISEIVNKNLE